LIDISEPTDCVVLQKSARKLLICSTGDTENRKIFCNLLIVADFVLRIILIGIVFSLGLLIKLYNPVSIIQF